MPAGIYPVPKLFNYLFPPLDPVAMFTGVRSSFFTISRVVIQLDGCQTRHAAENRGVEAKQKCLFVQPIDSTKSRSQEFYLAAT